MLTRHEITVLDLYSAHYYYGSSNNNGAVKLTTFKGFKKSNVDAVTAVIKQLSAKDTLAHDDRVFFTPFSKVPRYKFNEYAKDKPKLARTIMMNKATAIVLNPSSIMDGLKLPAYTSKYKCVNVSDLSALYAHLDKETTINIKSQQYVYFHDGYVSTFNKLEPNFKGQITDEQIYSSNSYSEAAVTEALEAINDIIATNGTKKIISDDTLLGEINQGTIISPEMFDELSSMLGSSDNDTVGLAMEVMANADYVKSELKMLTLLNRFYTGKMSYHKNAHLVNFRSLMEYFSKYDWQGTVVGFSNTLVVNANPASEDYAERIEMVRKNILSYVNEMLEGTKFMVNDVEINAPAPVIRVDESPILVEQPSMDLV